ncbi:hypothetical protein F383_03982 [Gossypium arboreum]|uniref:Uncharacterized protein n=1 Tax=Gossypium arboreum TaxID=29729 RepID=A0A0B0P132_GOSAR|nr:hypothetical protein F383_03982 [Gossypium arboreum]
MIFKATVMH